MSRLPDPLNLRDILRVLRDIMASIELIFNRLGEIDTQVLELEARLGVAKEGAAP
jgi:hypothetical protein